MTNETTDALRAFQLPELLDYESTASLLGISSRTLRRIVERGALSPIYVSPQRPKFRIEDVAASDLAG